MFESQTYTSVHVTVRTSRVPGNTPIHYKCNATQELSVAKILGALELRLSLRYKVDQSNVPVILTVMHTLLLAAEIGGTLSQVALLFILPWRFCYLYRNYNNFLRLFRFKYKIELSNCMS